MFATLFQPHHLFKRLPVTGRLNRKRRAKSGRLYLTGEQTHLRAAVARALGLAGRERRLTFNISIDILKSLKTGDVVYRVDYSVGGEGKS